MSFGSLFADLADTALRHLPLYRHLCRAIAEDEEVAGRLSHAPVEQQLPTLLLAAVHDVLLAGSTDRLGEWYSSVTDAPRPVGEGHDDPWPHFRRLSLEEPGVVERIRARATQTNEIGRCAALLPALQAISRHAPGAPPGGGRPLGLIDLGTSAGLNLLLDSYRYRYHRGSDPASADVVATVSASTDGPVELGCELRGPVDPPLEASPPPIAARFGIDVRPVDLSDPEEARWLVACQWPDQPERIRRLRAAIAMARTARTPIIEGDLVDQVAHAVDQVPAHALPVCGATWALAYLSPGRQEALIAELDRIGASRDLTLLFSEQPVMVPGLIVPPRPDGQADGGPTALVQLDWRAGEQTARRLADQHPHGTWLEWLAP